ncbi:hypothetical protein NW072_04850 [Mycoplasmopsis felis]|uniref:hypothetical protein n=1 Tax=Mycoplasmopsis felis TaxID=33923 RepID=UPI0021AE4DBC|nr:hypothetical protein [Mycoplasmopsis felis]UWV79357.1 hypothetical protein NW072_04850 [Mycoplasmopsis felis]
MYPNELIYLWLDQLKQNLAIADNLRDNVLLDYIEVARENIWLQYYELDFKNGEIPEDHPWAWDKKTMLATLHLAATYFMNPDITQRGNNIIDERMIYRILGDRVSYGEELIILTRENIENRS